MLCFGNLNDLSHNCAPTTTNCIGRRKEDVRFGGILFIVGALCCARYSFQYFFVVRFMW